MKPIHFQRFVSYNEIFYFVQSTSHTKNEPKKVYIRRVCARTFFRFTYCNSFIKSVFLLIETIHILRT